MPRGVPVLHDIMVQTDGRRLRLHPDAQQQPCGKIVSIHCAKLKKPLRRKPFLGISGLSLGLDNPHDVAPTPVVAFLFCF